MEVWPSQKGKEICGYRGYMYRVDSVNHNTHEKRWRCTKSRCTGKLLSNTENQEPMEYGDNHIHLPDPEAVTVKKTVAEMKIQAANSTGPIPAIYDQVGK